MIWPRLLPRLDLALLLAMATAWAISHRQGLDVAAIEAAVGDMGAWAPLAYISLFALAAVLFVPGSILSLAGGGLFGPVWGKAYALLGATVRGWFGGCVPILSPGSTPHSCPSGSATAPGS